MSIDKQTGWGLIGASTIARQYMVEAIRAQAGQDVVAVMSSSSERAGSFAAELQIRSAYDSLDAPPADPAVHAGYSITPKQVDFAYAICPAKAGMHVLCENPV